MTNKELIETAKQAMKDLWELNQGRLLEHEQTAYNCLRLFCERLPEQEPCDGNCGMNYCDENGCTERKRVLTDPCPPDAYHSA